MIRVFIMSVEPLSDPAVYAEAAAKAGAQRRERAERAKRPGDRYLSLGAGILLRYALQKHLEESAQEKDRKERVRDCPEGKAEACPKGPALVSTSVQAKELLREIETAEEAICRYGPHGKPYLERYPEMFFSLSHSGTYALCAAADREIGADIQRWQEACRTDRVAERYFLRAERNWYRTGCSEQEQKERFCRLWTAREAYMKLTGEGLSRDMKSYFVDPENGIVRDGKNDSLCAYLYEPAAPKGYAAAVSVFAARGTDHRNLS